MFLKDGLSKNIALECDLSCIIRKDNFSCAPKYLILGTGKERSSFLKKYMEI